MILILKNFINIFISLNPIN